MLNNLSVILVNPRFPENIGMAARACVNMGVSELTVVAPQMWKLDRILSLATPKGEELVGNIGIADTLVEALHGVHTVYGTTARTGGWRNEIVLPERAAPHITSQIAAKERVAVVFGREDRGLTNEETELCDHLITIPTNPDASSLNLAQAVLLICYECFKHARTSDTLDGGGAESRLCTHDERETMITTLRTTLLKIGYLRSNNPDYFMLPVRRFLQKLKLRRHEFSMVMGVCRQVGWLAERLDQLEPTAKEQAAELDASAVDEKA